MSKDAPVFKLTAEQQAAYEQYKRDYALLSPEEREHLRHKRKNNNIASGLGNVSAALMSDASDEEIAAALEKDEQDQKSGRRE